MLYNGDGSDGAGDGDGDGSSLPLCLGNYCLSIRPWLICHPLMEVFQAFMTGSNSPKTHSHLPPPSAAPAPK